MNNPLNHNIPQADERQHDETLLNLPPLTGDNPLMLFEEWFQAAKTTEPSDANAMSLATIDKQGMPNVRILLLKDYNEQGFTFFTNYNSQKGQELAIHPQAALCFHWKTQLKQVRIQGIVVKTDDALADSYFYSRARQSQIGSWVSQQSDKLTTRDEMVESYHDYCEKFSDTEVIPRPDYWGGYCLVPHRIEFWRNGAYRLHDRLVFTRANADSAWETHLIYP